MPEIENSTCDGVKITLLCDNYSDGLFSKAKNNIIIRKPQGMRCLGELGLSLFVEIESNGENINILFDTGGIKKTLLNNINELDVNLETVKYLVISHGDFDHVGAIHEAIEKIPNVEVYCHPKIDTKYHASPIFRNIELPAEKVDKKTFRQVKKKFFMIGVKMITTFDALEEKVNSVGGKLIKFEGMKKLIPGVYIYNNLNYYFELERPKWIIKEEDKMFSYTDYAEETYIAIHIKDKGWVVLAACSHSGILNAIETVRKKFNEPILAVIGGFHLFNIPEERAKVTLNYFKTINPHVIVPMHCAGRQFINKINVLMPDQVVISNVGTQINL